jgi:hypothetical protein
MADLSVSQTIITIKLKEKNTLLLTFVIPANRYQMAIDEAFP